MEHAPRGGPGANVAAPDFAVLGHHPADGARLPATGIDAVAVIDLAAHDSIRRKARVPVHADGVGAVLPVRSAGAVRDDAVVQVAEAPRPSLAGVVALEVAIPHVGAFHHAAAVSVRYSRRVGCDVESEDAAGHERRRVASRSAPVPIRGPCPVRQERAQTLLAQGGSTAVLVRPIPLERAAFVLAVIRRAAPIGGVADEGTAVDAATVGSAPAGIFVCRAVPEERALLDAVRAVEERPAMSFRHVVREDAAGDGVDSVADSAVAFCVVADEDAVKRLAVRLVRLLGAERSGIAVRRVPDENAIGDGGRSAEGAAATTVTPVVDERGVADGIAVPGRSVSVRRLTADNQATVDAARNHGRAAAVRRVVREERIIYVAVVDSAPLLGVARTKHAVRDERLVRSRAAHPRRNRAAARIVVGEGVPTVRRRFRVFARVGVLEREMAERGLVDFLVHVEDAADVLRVEDDRRLARLLAPPGGRVRALDRARTGDVEMPVRVHVDLRDVVRAGSDVDRRVAAAGVHGLDRRDEIRHRAHGDRLAHARNQRHCSNRKETG